MDISLDKNAGKFVINSYHNGTIVINQQNFSQPVILSLQELVIDKLPDKIEKLNTSMLQKLSIEKYEVVILGTGKQIEFPNWELIEQAQMMGSPLEVMATDAACRTFTVLASEGRNLLALLYP